MKINEVITEARIGDRLKSFAYKNLGGMGGASWQGTAGKVGFLDNFERLLQQYKDSSEDSGTPPDYKDFVLTYLNKNGWNATGKQVTQAASLANNPEMMANYIHKLTMNQSKANQAMRNKAASMGQARNVQQPSPNEDPNLSTQTKQVLATIDKLHGAGNLDDLAIIAKKAMQVLYSQNPTKYTELYKEVMTGKSKPAPAKPTAQPKPNATEPEIPDNIHLGYNE